MSYRVITAVLTARVAVHVGSGKDNAVTDALIRRDAKGQPFLPGTAVAGALRSLLTRLAPRLGFKPCRALSGEERQKSCNCAVCGLFGDVNPSDEDESTSAASRVLVFNARPNSPVPRSLVRDGVGVDRTSGTAARAGAVKFDLEVLPAGASFMLRMELRDAIGEDETLLAAGLAEWEAGRFWLGGRVARGLGAFDLSELHFKTLELGTAGQVIGFLREDKPWCSARTEDGWLQKQLGLVTITPADPETDGVARGWFSLRGTLRADGALLTNDTLAAGASGFDHAPLLGREDNWDKPVLTGAGLRGVLRSHAERLARTLVSFQSADKDDFLRRCPACDPNVRDQDNDQARRLGLESCDSLVKKSGVPSDVEVENDRLCLACRFFGSSWRGSRLIVEDGLYQATETQPKPVFKMLDFLAIDRFTGGGAEGLKFDALALWQPAFTLRLHLENPAPWELGWLWLVLRDLAEGWLTVGFGGAKGFGRVTLTDWEATFGFLRPEDFPNLTKPGLVTKKSGVYATATFTETEEGWGPLVERWTDAFGRAATSFSRREESVLTEDSYFDRLKPLYPLEKEGIQ
ncbi:MAG: RAMP superfamily CRISPR-associated protein [Peptococcaceae bacterium]|jgi:CRISPR/Cas system CSM-associated protein Csm3 (group 7 of RAMP superfamily)|nr:RAMP superfamily CRISPR-associated protein [Peptococcaceae bacterium]